MIAVLQAEAVGWVGISPALMLAATALAIFGYDMVRPDATRQGVLVIMALIGSVSASVLAGALLATGAGPEPLFGGALIVDGFALFFALIVGLVTTLVLLGAAEYLGGGPHRAEFYTLVLFAATGMTLMAAAQSLATVFVALELASLPSYALVAYLKQDRGSVEAGLKYFLVGAVASAVFAFGISLVYAGRGPTAGFDRRRARGIDG
jgi:F420H2 dehydrogenase subunit N/NADH dehydrogenase subunit N (EC 1.6.5.3)